MAETNDIDALILKATAALKPLTETTPTHLRTPSNNDRILEAVSPIILAARAKRHGYKHIAEILKSSGVHVSAETLRRRFAGTPSDVSNAHANSRKKKTSSISETPRRTSEKQPKNHTSEQPVIHDQKPTVEPHTTQPPATVAAPQVTHAGARRAEA